MPVLHQAIRKLVEVMPTAVLQFQNSAGIGRRYPMSWFLEHSASRIEPYSSVMN